MKLSSRKVVKKNIFLWCSRLMNPKVKQICQLLFPKSTVNIQWKCRPTTTRSPRSAGKKIKQFEELCLCKSLFKKNIMIIILHECLPKLRIHLGKVNYCFIFSLQTFWLLCASCSCKDYNKATTLDTVFIDQEIQREAKTSSQKSFRNVLCSCVAIFSFFFFFFRESNQSSAQASVPVSPFQSRHCHLHY